METVAEHIPLVDLKAQYAAIGDEIDAAIAAVIARTAFVGGPFVAAFEAAFAHCCEVRHAVGCGNGTDAIRLALEALGIGAGDEVILPSHTFFATPEAVLQIGAVPVYADVEEGGFNLDPAAIPPLLSDRTRAILPVHLYGQPCDMEAILELAREHSLAVVEDCAQAHGARYKGRRVGTLGDAGCFSFYPGKNLGAYGDAGAVVTHRDDVAAHVTMARNHARQSKYEHQGVGLNSRLDGLQASILSAKLAHLEDWCDRRRRVAAHYDELLAAVPEVETPQVLAETEPVYHLYVVRVPERDAVLASLKERGIGASIHYPVPCHAQPCSLDADGEPQVSLPRTERLAGEILSLPIYPELGEAQIRRVVERLREAVASTQPAGVEP